MSDLKAKKRPRRPWLNKKKKNTKTENEELKERIRELEKQQLLWKLEEDMEEAERKKGEIRPDESQGQKYDKEGNLIEIKAADGGYIKQYAHGGGVRKAKFMDD